LEPTLRDLGKRWAAQGALPTHYATVARTFVDTVREMWGIGWQARYTRAWKSLFDAVAKTMVRGATAKAPAPAANVARPVLPAKPYPAPAVKPAAAKPAVAKPAATKPAVAKPAVAKPAAKAATTETSKSKKPAGGGKGKRAA
jgi:hypothetical protein